MSARGNGLVLWVLGGAGTLFVYAAIKNKSPASVISARLAGGQIVNITPPAGPVQNPNIPSNPGNQLPFSGGAFGANPSVNTTGLPYVQPDITGLYSAYAPNGIALGVLPTLYQKSPGTYIVPTVQGA